MGKGDTAIRNGAGSASIFGRKMRGRLACASALIMFCGADVAIAQAAKDAPAEKAASDESDILVTASRINRTGFTAPTPTTMVDLEDIARQGAPNVADALNHVPSFQPSTTPATAGNSSVGVGANFLNLRGLGANRTLILVNGRRHVPTSINGLVDINLIPQALIERVEVVTGGASAAWGSDAVSGVVNFILNEKLDGFQGSAQYGFSQRDDNHEKRFSLAYGTGFAGGRGHISIAGELVSGDGVTDQKDRAWGRREWQVIANPASGPGQPTLLVLPNVHQSNRTEGGLVVGGRYAGTQFLPGATYGPFRYGSPRNATFMAGGDGINQGLYTSLVVPLNRKTLSAITTYEITDNVRATIEGSFGQSKSVNAITQSFSFAPYSIQKDNAFLPRALADGMAPGEVMPLGRLNTDFGFITADTTVKAYRGVAALDGKFGDGWQWSAYYQYGRTRYHGLLLGNPIVANLNRAIDSVIDPVSKQPICRSTLSSPGDGCVPINLFGYGSPKQDALNYVLGTQVLDQTLRQDAAGVDIQGEPFSTWAGPVSFAAGAEYRRESARVRVDPRSQASAFLIGNPKALSGHYSVKEAFAEFVVPLLSDAPMAKALELNGAARVTDYSVSGTVATWKAGLTYKVNDSLRFRGTRSRDIRAPNLNEIFSPASLVFANIRDPRDGSTSLVTVNLRGNPALQPEKADTLTAGVVIEPSFLPGLHASIDYYDISLKGAIQTLAPQEIVNRCYAGATELCVNVSRNGANAITNIVSAFYNLSSLKSRGVDFELGYATPIQGFVSGAPGEFRARLLGTYIAKQATNDGVNKVDRAGEVGPLNGGVPSWRMVGNLGYREGPASLSLTGRFIAGGKYDNTLVEGIGINDNTIPSRFYLDGTIEYTLLDSGRNKLQLFGVVNNILDKDPPIAPINFQNSVATNNALYDVVGRSFVIGLRWKL